MSGKGCGSKDRGLSQTFTTSPAWTMTDFKYQHGRLSYLKKSTGQERGREDWQLTRNRNGSVTLRSLAMTDDSKIVRDVVFTRGKDGRPADAFIRLQIGDKLIGTGCFRIENDKLVVVADSSDTGHVIQTLNVPTDAFSIVTQALMLDGWAIFSYDRARGGEQLRTFYNAAIRWNGSGSMGGPLGRVETFRLNMIGEEEITVPAGTFKAVHFTIEYDERKAPTSHFWVAGEDKILLRCDLGEMDHEYVLTSWKTEKHQW